MKLKKIKEIITCDGFWAGNIHTEEYKDINGNRQKHWFSYYSKIRFRKIAKYKNNERNGIEITIT